MLLHSVFLSPITKILHPASIKSVAVSTALKLIIILTEYDNEIVLTDIQSIFQFNPLYVRVYFDSKFIWVQGYLGKVNLCPSRVMC